MRHYIQQQMEPGSKYWTAIAWTDKGKEDAERIRQLLTPSCSTPLRVKRS